MGDREDGLAAVGGRLREWRLRQAGDLSQSAAAKQIKAHQVTWGDWERGAKGPDLHFAFAIEELTGGEIKAEDWAFPRKGSLAASDASGEHPAVIVPRTG